MPKFAFFDFSQCFNRVFSIVGLKKLAPVFCCLLLSGCSISFIYNNLDWWVGWYLDDYVDLTRDQQKQFDQSFEQLHLWHRREQLPLYVEQLERLKQQVLTQTISPLEIDQHLEQVRAHWFNLATQAEPELTRLTQLLNTEQRAELLDAIKEENQDLRDDREQLSDEEKYKERAKDQTKQFKKWFGRLTEQQKEKIAEQVKEYQSSYDDWLDYRDLWLAQFTQVLDQSLIVSQYQAQFKALLLDSESLRTAEHLAKIAHNRQVFNEIFYSFSQSLTEKQKKTFNRRIDDLIEDLTELSNK